MNYLTNIANDMDNSTRIPFQFVNILITIVIVFLCFFMIVSCSNNNKEAQNEETNHQIVHKIQYRKTNNLCIYGNFTVLGKIDTLCSFIYSAKDKIILDSIPDFSSCTYEDMENWIYDNEIVIYLSINNKGIDSLFLGAGMGLYCLLNLGDNNDDGFDEFCLVIDKPDFSRINDCMIYSICNNNWVLHKIFQIHEDAFDYKSESESLFNGIPQYLHFIDNQWYYKDYSTIDYDTEQEVGKMKKLILEKCR